MAWFVYIDAKWNVKPHFVATQFKDSLDKYLVDKYDSEMSEELSRFEEKVRFEPGGYGIYAMNQPRMLLNALGSPLEIDCSKLEHFFEILKAAKGKRFADGSEYFKLYSRMSCLVLSASQRETLLFQAWGKIDEAEELADNFFNSSYKLLEDDPLEEN